METSIFSESCNTEKYLEKIETRGATCDTFRTKMYGKLVFVKRLKEKYISDIRYREALKKEFEVGFRIEHPNLPRYISFNGNEILLEYIDGETLTERIKNNPEYFTRKENSDKFISQLLSAVKYMHRNQVLHLDIKPDNILITRINNDVKLIDLGFCYTDCYTDTTGHTKQFCSPEQLKGNSIDERSDIYSIGRIIELLPNKHLYRKIITRCTAKDKDERYKKVEDISLPKNSRWKFALIAVFVSAILIIVLMAQHNREQQEPARHIATEIKKQSSIPIIQEVRDSQYQEKAKPLKAETKKKPTPSLKEMLEQDEEYKRNIARAYESGRLYRQKMEEDFEKFKPKLNEYLKDIIDFVNNDKFLKEHPSYLEYNAKYKELWREALNRMSYDEWTYKYYKSLDNPFSTFKSDLVDSIERKFQSNANKLP